MNNKFVVSYKETLFALFTLGNSLSRAVGKTFASAGIAVLFGSILLIASASAQNTVTGAFQGDVSNNQTGNPLTASVEITNEQTGAVYTPPVDSKGRFYQGLLAPGFYTIRVSSDGFRTKLLRREIKISLTGDIVPVPVSLEPETTVSTPPTVPEEANDIRVEINTTDARQSGSFREEEPLKKLPLGATTVTRSFDELATLLPGVAPPPQTIGDVAGPGVGPGVGSAGQFSVNGLRSRANNFTVDGSDNNDEDIGVRRQGFVALIPQPIESIQEFQIISLLAPAQFGRNIGAQVNAVSKAGGNNFNGTLYGFFNSDRLNARNIFDTANGSESFALKSASDQAVLLDGNPLTVQNRSGGKDSFTFGQGGGTLGGAIMPNKLFYFVSGEFQKINAVQEKSFAVPTIEQRGAFRTGATGVFRNPFNNALLPNPAIPNALSSAAIFSLFPFANSPNGIYGENTFTQVLPASGRGVILSGRLDDNFTFKGRQQSFTARYNFTDDDKNIPAVNEAIFSTVRSKIQTQNLSLFLNSQINDSGSGKPVFNQFRFSFGRTRLNFNEVRNSEFLIPSSSFPDTPFLLNTRLRLNVTQPSGAGVPNTGAVLFNTFFPAPNGVRVTATEPLIGPLGQVKLAGFSTLGADVYNFPQNRINKTFQLADELTYRLEEHSLVFGFDTRRTDLDSDLPRLSRPLVTFNGSPRLIFENSAFRFPTAADPNPILRPEDLLGLTTASDFLLTFNVDRPDSKVNLRYYQLDFYGQDTWRIRPNLSLSYGLRYEYNTPVKEINGLIEKTFSDPRLSIVPGLSRLIDGRDSLYEPDRNNFAPRIGIAYSPKFLGGNRLSVFRAGYGIFYDQILGAVVNQSRNVFPTFLTLNYGGLNSRGETSLILFNPGNTVTGTRQGVNIRLNAPGTVNIFNPALNLREFIEDDRAFFPNAINVTLPAKNLEMPMAHHYSFTFEQQLNSNYSISAGYIGTTGQKLLRFETPNLGSSITVAPTSLQTAPIPVPGGQLFIPFSSGRVFNPNRPIGDIGAVNLFSTTAGSNYNSLQTQLRGRFFKSLNFQLSYTFSKVLDDVSDVFDLAGASVLPQNSLTFDGERAPANFDVRHRFSYNVIYDVSRLRGNRFLARLTDGLQIAGTGRFHTGQPFTVNSIIDVNLDGNLTDRLNNTNGLIVTGDGRQPLRLETNNPFTLLAPFGQDGQIKRNSFRAGKVIELDLSVIKRWTFSGRELLFRADIFNFINRANFGVPIRFLEAPGFGKAVNTVTPARRVQFSLKYNF